MTPAALRAAAYTYATGSFPKGLQWRTRSALYDVATYTPGARKVAGVEIGAHIINPDALDVVRAQPLAQAHDFLIGCGFRQRWEARADRHSVPYSHRTMGDEAHAWRDGGGSVWIKRGSVPYQVSLGFTAAQIVPYLDVAQGVTAERIAAGWRVAWPLWVGVVQALLGERWAGAYDDDAARLAHSEGRDPIAYSVAAVRRALGDEPTN